MSMDQTVDTALRDAKSYIIEGLSRNFGECRSKRVWIVGCGDGSGLLGPLQRICERVLNERTQFDHVIRIPVLRVIDGTSGSTAEDAIYEAEKRAVLAVANALDLMDEHDSEFRKLDEERYYSYGEFDKWNVHETKLIRAIKESIYKKLAGKRCLIIVENLLQPINDPIINKWLMQGWLPLPMEWSESSSWWLISTPSHEVCARSLGESVEWVVDLEYIVNFRDNLSKIGRGQIRFVFLWSLPFVTLDEELWCVAQSISSSSSRLLVCSKQGSTVDILWNCLLYTLLLSPLVNVNKIQQKEINDVKKENCTINGAKEELIRFWISEGLFTRTIKLNPTNIGLKRLDEFLIVQLEEEEEEQENTISNTNAHELFELARTILEALLSTSLLRSCQPPPTSVSFPSPDNTSCIFPFPGLWQLLHQRKIRYEKISFEGLGLLTEGDISNPTKLAKKNWMSFATHDTCKYLEFRNPNESKTTTLMIRDKEDISQPIIEALLSKMPYLRVLDLSYTSIESLPPSLAHLTNLRLLSMKHCRNLFSLVPNSSTSSPISFLERLEVLDLHDVPLTEIPDDLGNKKCKIYYLDLSCPTITSLPCNLFSDMETLRELVFLGCKSLSSLPPSMASLTNLEILSVSETKLTSFPPDTFKQMLRLRVLKLINNNLLEKLPKSLCEAQNLEEVELNGCRSLIAIDALPINNLRALSMSDFQSITEIKIIGLMSLKSFSLTHSPIISLSLRGCRELEIVVLSELDKLEELDLSSTAIKELPSWITGLHELRKLDVRGVPHLERVPWHLLDRVPELFNLDQCEHFITTNGDSDAHTGGVHISVRDLRLLYKLDRENFMRLVDGGESLQSFYILVSSCEKRKEKMSRSSSRSIQPQLHGASCIYKDAYNLIKDLIPIPPTAQQSRHRHVEISSTEQCPDGLKGILGITESLSVTDNEHLLSVTRLNPTIPMLTSVLVERCQRMQEIFDICFGEYVATKLQNICAGHLPQITSLIKEALYEPIHGRDFIALQHLHVYNCGKLKRIFPDRLVLPSLETITITYCNKLQTVFYKSTRKPVFIENRLQSLHNIRFEELPQIRNIYEDQEQWVSPLKVPQLKTLYFRGCWSLRQLPLLEGPREQRVCVDGEFRQCEKIKVEMKVEQLSHYEFKSPPHVASLKDYVKNRIFLRF